MSLHRSLKTKPMALAQHRNVLTRPERISKMKETEKFQDGRSPLGLPKIGNRMMVAAKKPKKEAAAEGEGAAPAAGAAGKAAAPAGKAAPAAKGAAKK